MKEIKLSQGRVALVDDEDYERLLPYGWYYNERYAKATINYKKVYMHKFLIHPPDGYLVDHKDGNTLNNQKSNLRICNQSQNCQNRSTRVNKTSLYKGVSLLTQKKKYKSKIYIWQTWHAHIMTNGTAIKLGSFKNERDAAMAYNEAALKYHGEFAKLNVI